VFCSAIFSVQPSFTHYELGASYQYEAQRFQCFNSESCANLLDTVRVGKAPPFSDICLSNLVTGVAASRRSRSSTVTASTIVGVLVSYRSLYVSLQFYAYD
jgi:hypothetical protein